MVPQIQSTDVDLCVVDAAVFYFSSVVHSLLAPGSFPPGCCFKDQVQEKQCITGILNSTSLCVLTQNIKLNYI